MFRILSLLLLLMILPYSLWSQIVPREGSELNYRLIGFHFSPTQNITTYDLEIASGNYDSEDSFEKNIILKQETKANKIVAEVPSFGNQYTWRVVYTTSKSIQTKSALHHFATGTIPEVDINNTRLRITQQALTFKDAYVFLDGNKVLYDMKGNPVWYLPQIEGGIVSAADLKLSPQGTITFINGADAYEINYEGNVLWKPNHKGGDGQQRVSYHHEFTRLNNGHYMLLGRGSDEVLWKRPASISKDSNSYTASDDKTKTGQDDTSFTKIPLGTIIEYDEMGNVVWSWKSSKYYQESDLINYIRPDGQPIYDIHENSFFFDEKDKVIYLSYKGISRIIKIKYPEGNVINTYGDVLKEGVPEYGNESFCGQHSVKRSRDGCVFLFNNNGCNPGCAPKIKKFREPVSKNESLKKIWEYQCTVEGDAPKVFHSGGNVIELHDASLFVCIGGPCGKTFIVSPDKEILWSAQSEKWIESDKKWHAIGQYRASIIEDKKELEHLIWNTEINDIAETKHNEIKSKRIAGALQ